MNALFAGRERPNSVRKVGALLGLSALATLLALIIAAPAAHADQIGPFVQVSSGDSHTCAVTKSGAAVCWGISTSITSNHGQADPPGGLFKQVSAGAFHTCAIKQDDTVQCWGQGTTGCEMNSNMMLICWDEQPLQSTPPAGQFKKISAGYQHTCGIKTDGTIACWGLNDYGQATPPTAGGWSELSAGYKHTCAIGTEGTLCWGAGKTMSGVEPNWGQSMVPGHIFTHIAAGQTHTCAINNFETVECWGETNWAPPPAGTFVEIAVGWRHSCARNSVGAVECWGENTAGQLNHPSATLTQLSSGYYTTCGLRSDNAVTCWGDNSFGEVSGTVRVFPQVSAGAEHTCFLQKNGSVTCWGSNASAQAAAQTGPFTQLSAGTDHTCAEKRDGTWFCWGSNASGQSTVPANTYSRLSAGDKYTCGIKSNGYALCWGLNTSNRATAPTTPTFTGISAGWTHTCAVKPDGYLQCWGLADSGATTPPSGAFSDVAVGQSFACGIKVADLNPACWGLNTSGQAPSPWPLNWKDAYVQISAGVAHGCGLLDHGAIFCWGSDTYGQVTHPNSYSPFKQFDAGAYHTCGVMKDGSVKCWGRNDKGQATVPTLPGSPREVYAFDGFYPPVDPAPAFNEVKAGRTIPLKFSLGGDYGPEIIADGYPASLQVACDQPELLGELEATETPGESALSFDADSSQYSFEWKTDKAWERTCRALVLRLADGLPHVALFQFK